MNCNFKCCKVISGKYNTANKLRLFGVLCALLVAFGLSQKVLAKPSNTLENLRYLVDNNGTYSIDIAQKELFQRANTEQNDSWENLETPVVSFGFRKERYWFSWQVTAPPDQSTNDFSQEKDYILEVPFPSFDYLNIWIFNSDGQLIYQRATGDQQPFYRRDIASRKFLFPVKWDGRSSLNFIMSVKTNDTMRFASRFEQADSFWAEEEQHTLVHGIYAGVFLAMFILYVSVTARIGSRHLVYYTLWLPCISLSVFTDLGYGFEYLWPESIYWNDRAYAVLSSLGVTIGILFIHSALSINRKDYPIESRLIMGAATLNVCSALSGLVLPTFYILQIASLAAMPIVPLLFYVIAIRLRNTELQNYLLLLAICSVTATGSVRVLNNFGLFSSVQNIEYFLEIGTAIEVMLLSIYLAARFNKDRKDRLEAQNKLIAFQKTMYSDLEVIVKERTAELAAANKRLAETSVTDPLTGLKNRRYFDENFGKLVDFSSRANTGIGLMMIDLDYFKKINDTYGHQMGDECLKHFAEVVQSIVKRESDIIARYGGEEFIVALANTTWENSLNTAEKLCRELERFPMIRNSIRINLKCSIGLAFKDEVIKSDVDALVKEADEALYQAKANGRNRVATLNDWNPDTEEALA